MERPASIVRFEQLYAAHIGVGLAASLLALMNSGAALLASGAAEYTRLLLPAGMVIALLTQAALWFGIARKGASVAKWILVVFTAVNVLGALFAVFVLVTGFGGAGTSLPSLALSLVASVLLYAAVSMLFRPDTKPSFGEGDAAA